MSASNKTVSLITEANNHGEDCGQPGLQDALTARTQSGYAILGIGANATQAFTPYRTTIKGERIAIEVKIRRDTETEVDALDQVAEYLDHAGLAALATKTPPARPEPTTAPSTAATSADFIIFALLRP